MMDKKCVNVDHPDYRCCFARAYLFFGVGLEWLFSVSL
ncbi:hypothetical protein REIFOR_01837 [Reinekea forsetii]|uniref:Uncharacterized protein n=1 Tax=Reinekea forsetii TaxID=1336806 RepID=A0A2K8KUI1_9GAMM|nr:hypothetical protein REIFOR_01837 [Reinekea forsetii]